MTETYKSCPECTTIMPANCTRKFCSKACLMSDMEKYWDKPRIKKRWYEPVKTPEVKPVRKINRLHQVEDDLKQLERLLVIDRVDLEGA